MNGKRLTKRTFLQAEALEASDMINKLFKSIIAKGAEYMSAEEMNNALSINLDANLDATYFK